MMAGQSARLSQIKLWAVDCPWADRNGIHLVKLPVGIVLFTCGCFWRPIMKVTGRHGKVTNSHDLCLVDQPSISDRIGAWQYLNSFTIGEVVC